MRPARPRPSRSRLPDGTSVRTLRLVVVLEVAGLLGASGPVRQTGPTDAGPTDAANLGTGGFVPGHPAVASGAGLHAPVQLGFRRRIRGGRRGQFEFAGLAASEAGQQVRPHFHEVQVDGGHRRGQSELAAPASNSGRGIARNACGPPADDSS